MLRCFLSMRARVAESCFANRRGGIGRGGIGRQELASRIGGVVLAGRSWQPSRIDRGVRMHVRRPVRGDRDDHPSHATSPSAP